MSSENKAAKAALKEAKDFLTKKDFKSALRCCKKALNVDKNNYMALVFCGLCLLEMQQPDQALQAYKRAVESDPTQMTGWQGLAAFYEKQLAAASESDIENRKKLATQLLETYTTMLALTKDADKYQSLSEKIVDLNLKVLVNLDGVVTTLKVRAEFMGVLNDKDRTRQAHADLVRILNTQQIGVLNPSQEQIFRDSLQKVINDGSSIQNLEHLKINIRLLYKLREMEQLCACAFKLNSIFPDNVFALEWICKLYLEWVTGALDFHSSHLETNPDHYINKLLSLSPTSTLAQLAKGAFTWHRLKNSQEASKLLAPILERTTNPNFFGVFILCTCLFEIQHYASCEHWLGLAPALLDKVKEDETRELMKNRLDNMTIKTLYSQAKYEKAGEILEQCFGDSGADEPPETKILRAKIFARMGRENQVDQLLEKFDLGQSTKIIRAILMRAKKQFSEALSLIKDFLENSKSLDSAEQFEAMVLQGELLWDSEKHDESLPVFLRSAQLNPNNWIPFLYLGRYYNSRSDNESKRDAEKARKCYFKSFNINPRSDEAGMALSDIYREQGKWEENEQFLTAVSRQSSGATWAHLRLGIHYLSHEEPSRAILSLQSVLRSEPSNINAWECLADAYFARGSFNSALKAYDHASKLLNEAVDHCDPNEAVHARLQVATIKLQLGHFRDAIEALESIIMVNNTYIPALKCLSEALIEEAKVFLTEFLNGKAVDNCEKAVRVLAQVIELLGFNQLSCVWKLLGDALSVAECLPDATASIIVPAKLLQTNSDERLRKWDLLNLSAKCYARSLQIEDLPGGWQDLGMAYYLLAEASKKRQDGPVVTDFLRKSESCIRKAISMDSGNSHALWNLLGVVAFAGDNHALAQHSFIKSVTSENNSIAWTNLGILYLVLGQCELANKAFKESQNSDPAYLRGWVGQALLAELMGYDAESMDLFRHATFLGNELESSVGYANWVCKTLALIGKDEIPAGGKVTRQRYCVEKMHGVSIGVDCLTRYADRVRDDPCALNMLAVLLEKENLLRSACTALLSAQAILETKVGDKNYDSVHLNLGRVLFKLSDYEGSLIAYKKIVKPDFQSLVGLALACNKAGHFEEAYNAYKGSLSMASHDGERSHVLAAMATIAYKFQGANAAKTLLFQSTQLKPTSMDGLLALCILGIKQSDGSLIKAALGEMEKRLDEKGGSTYRPDFVSIKALTLVLQGKKNEARLLLCRAVHTWPESARLRRALALFSVHFENLQKANSANAETIARCAEIASGLGRNESESVEMACLVGVGRTLSRQTDESGLRAAIKVAHMYPGSPQAWSVLVCAAVSIKTRLSSQTVERLVEISHEMSKISDSTNQAPNKLETWIRNYREAFASTK